MKLRVLTGKVKVLADITSVTFYNSENLFVGGLHFPGDVSDQFTENQEVEVTVTAVPGEMPAAMVVTTIGRCPACDEFPATWNSMSVDCSECGVELLCNESVDETGASHWSFDFANQEDADRVAADRPVPSPPPKEIRE